MTHNAHRSRGGSHTELGMARKAGHRISIVGPKVQAFHHLHGLEHYPDVAAFKRTETALYDEGPHAV